ncbi:MAG: hypothetical protein WD772_02760 [Pseudohongiellaceae bacterium]
MSARLRHPNLKDKFNLLFSLRVNPTIVRNSDLARSLGVSRQAVNKWIHGDMTSQGSCIPPDQLDQISVLFGIPSYWFTETLSSFSSNISSKIKAAEKSGLQVTAPELRLFTSMLPLTDSSALGREQELEVLSHAWLGNECKLVQVIAFGGAGKTTLINSWLQKIGNNHFLGAQRIFAWSFHWQGSGKKIRSSADLFLENALEWFGDNDSLRGSPWSKATRLVNLIRRFRTVLILDGLETLQRPPGPEGGEIEDSGLALVLRELISAMNGICLVTSRIEISEVASFYGDSVKTLQLARLKEGVGIELLRRHGVHGENEEFKQAVKNYKGHALSLNLLAGYLNTVSEGKIEYWVNIGGLLAGRDKDSEADRIMRAYGKWFRQSSELSILFLVCIFNRPVTLGLLKKIVVKMQDQEGIHGLKVMTSDEWKCSLHKLQTAQLVTTTWNAQELLVDVHPLVSSYFSGQLRLKNLQAWRAAHLAIFETIVNDHNAADKNVSLEPLFQAVLHGCQANEYAKAFGIYEAKIKQGQISMYNMGSHHADLACLRQFFVDPWDRLVEELPDRSGFYLLSCVAANLVTLGRIDEAISPLRKSVNGLIAQGETMTAIVASGPLLSMLLYVGNLTEAFVLTRLIRKLAKPLGNRTLLAVVDNYVGHACFIAGKYQQAQKLFASAAQYYVADSPSDDVYFPMVSCFHALFLIESGDAQAGLERAQLSLRWRQQNAWQTRFDTTTLNAMDHLAVGLAYLRLGDLKNAEVFMETQIELLRAVDDWLFLPFGLTHRSELHLARGNITEARADIEESIRIAERTGAKLLLRDAYLAMCQVNLIEQRQSDVKEYLQLASDLQLESGYKSRFRELSSRPGSRDHEDSSLRPFPVP